MRRGGEEETRERGEEEGRRRPMHPAVHPWFLGPRSQRSGVPPCSITHRELSKDPGSGKKGKPPLLACAEEGIRRV
jgi:hypothetical protein